MVVMSVDPNCALLWNFSFPTGGSIGALPSSIEQTTDGGYLLSGTNFDLPNAPMWGIKLDVAGDIVWQKAYNVLPWTMHSTADCGFVVAGSYAISSKANAAWLLKLGSTGDLQWEHGYFAGSCAQGFTAFDAQPAAGEAYYLMLGGECADGIIAKLDACGTVDWLDLPAFASGNPALLIHGFTPTSDGGYAATGTVGSLSLPPLMTLKANSSGAVAPCSNISMAGPTLTDLAPPAVQVSVSDVSVQATNAVPVTVERALRRCSLLAMTMLASPWTAAATPSSGCGKTLASGTYQMTDQHVTRTYRVFVPSRYRPGTPYPLVIVFHGWGGDENEFLGDPSVTGLADERGYLVVAARGLGSTRPDDKPNSWSFRGSTTGLAGTDDLGGAHAAGAAATAAAAICDPARTPNFTYPSCKDVARNTCSWTQCQADDVAFALALVAAVESELCVDTAREFAAGGSNGGMFTWELGQNGKSARTFRAIAALIGLPHRGHLDAPARVGGMPVLGITGTHDTTVPPGAWENTHFTTSSDGSVYYYTGAAAMMRRWGNANGCPYSGKPAAAFNTRIPQADCRTYCSGSAQGWSGGSAGVGWPKVLDCRAATGHDYEFSWSWKLILDFFDAQSS
jgi:poly(3-hydroxybutyrate) depolymerase